MFCQRLILLLLLLLPAGGFAVTLEELTLEEMIAASTYIVRGRVEGVVGVTGASVLYTEYDLRVVEVLQGDLLQGELQGEATQGGGSAARLRLALPGGKVGNREQSFSGVPIPVAGKEYVFFLWRGRNGLLQLVGMTQGLLEVKRRTGVAIAERAPTDGMLLNRRSGLPVHDQGLRISLSRLRTNVMTVRGRSGGAQ